jgi:Xaa-Pro aminopeptidase
MTPINPPVFQTELYRQRRAQLAGRICEQSGGGVAILSTAPEQLRNRDSEFPYRHDSDFFYLTGFDEPGATLVLQVDRNTVVAHLFCRPKDAEREIWDGLRLGPEAAPDYLGIDRAYPNVELDQELPKLLADQTALYIRLASSAETDRRIRHWIDRVRGQARAGVNAPSEFRDIEALVHEMRLFKDASEVKTMRRAAAISAEAHLRAMRTCRPGQREYQIEAELLHAFRHSGAQSVAYNSIVAAGANVILNDIDENLCLEAVNRIDPSGASCIAFPGDSSNKDFIQQMVDESVKRFGQLNIVVANAGITLFGDFFTYSEEAFYRVLQVNLGGTFFLAQSASNQMKKQASGG